MAKVKLQPIHYRGAAPALNDIIAGHINLMSVSLSLVVQPADEKKLKVLGVGSAKQVKELAEFADRLGERRAGLRGRHLVRSRHHRRHAARRGDEDQRRGAQDPQRPGVPGEIHGAAAVRVDGEQRPRSSATTSRPRPQPGPRSSASRSWCWSRATLSLSSPRSGAPCLDMAEGREIGARSDRARLPRCRALPRRRAYPTKPITILVPAAPGGVSDSLARACRTAFHRDLGPAGHRREPRRRQPPDRRRIGREGLARRPHADARAETIFVINPTSMAASSPTTPRASRRSPGSCAPTRRCLARRPCRPIPCAS